MSTAIYRYELNITDEQTIGMPADAVILSAAFKPRDSQISLWAIVDTERTAMRATGFRIFGTGHPMPADMNEWRFVATCPMSNGLVFHVFTEAP